ncbi:MAG: hypothetical protein WA160_11700 [Pseudobdellovibrio sp.]
MKNLIYASGLLISFALFGCADKSSDPNIVQTPACAPGQYYSNGGCYSQNGLVGPSQINFTGTNGFYADNYSGTSRITIVNAAKMKELFKFGMGVCDRAAHNGGQANCDSYLSGQMDIIIQFPTGTASANTLLATIISKPKQNPNFNYGYQYPSGQGLLGAALGYLTGIYLPDPSYYSGATRNPLQLQMVVSAISAGAGFEARGYGDYWTGLNTTTVAIQVPQGKMENSNFSFNLQVQGTTAAQGTMNRCRLQNCGL